MRHILKAPKTGYEALDLKEAVAYKRGEIPSIQLHFLPVAPWPGHGDHLTIFFKNGKKRQALNGSLHVEEVIVDEGDGWIEGYNKYFLIRKK